MVDVQGKDPGICSTTMILKLHPLLTREVEGGLGELQGCIGGRAAEGGEGQRKGTHARWHVLAAAAVLESMHRHH